MYISDRAFHMNVSSREASRIDIKSTRHILVLYKFSAETSFSTFQSLGYVLGQGCWEKFSMYVDLKGLKIWERKQMIF